MVVPTLALGTLTFGLLAFSIRRGLQPLRDVAAQVRAHQPNDWTALPLQQVPAEAVPLIERINTLLSDVQHFVMLQRNLLYTGITRGRKLVALVGSRKALWIAVNTADTKKRFSLLKWRIKPLDE